MKRYQVAIAAFAVAVLGIVFYGQNRSNLDFPVPEPTKPYPTRKPCRTPRPDIFESVLGPLSALPICGTPTPTYTAGPSPTNTPTPYGGVPTSTPTPTVPTPTPTPTVPTPTPTPVPGTPTPTPTGVNYTVTTGSDCLVNGDNLVAVLASATRPSTILLQNGAEYCTGNRENGFELHNKTGSGWITIRTNDMSSMPAGERVSSADSAQMAKLTATTTYPIVTFFADADHWQLQGLEITNHTKHVGPGIAVVNINNGSITYQNWPHYITVDRCYVHPMETAQQSTPLRSIMRGFAIDGDHIVYTNNDIENFKGWQAPPTPETLVNSATATNPAVIHFNSGHGIASSPARKWWAYFEGATGNWASLNGFRLVTYVNANDLSVETYSMSTKIIAPLNAVGWGSLTGTVYKDHLESSASMGVTIGGGPGPYQIENNYIEAYYSGIFSGGNSGTYIDPANQVTVLANPAPTYNQMTLSGLGNLQVGDLFVIKEMEPQHITAAVWDAANSRTIFTTSTMGYEAGVYCCPDNGGEWGWRLAGFTGGWASMNRRIGQAIILNATTFSTNDNSSGWGTFNDGATATWVPEAPKQSWPQMYNWSVGKVTNIQGTTVTYVPYGNSKGHQLPGGQWQHMGNGAGSPAKVGSLVQFNGVHVDDITVRHNTMGARGEDITLYRDVAGTCIACDSGPKAVWESKTADHVLFEGNIVGVLPLGSWAGHTEGTGVALAMNQANQVGATPWVSNSHWTVQNNLFANYTYTKISGTEEYDSGLDSSDFVIQNNVFTQSKAAWTTYEGMKGLKLLHNTVYNKCCSSSEGGYNSAIPCFFPPNDDAMIRDNIFNWEIYGVQDQWAGYGLTPACWPNKVEDHNYIIDDMNVNFDTPPGDFKKTLAAMKFVNDATCANAQVNNLNTCKLQTSSPGYHGASDGTDAGANVDAVIQAVQ